jgi:hypothetical protein
MDAAPAPDASIADAGELADCYSPPVQPVGDGACYYDAGDGNATVGICPRPCYDAGSYVIGPLSPPDLPA